MKIASPEIYKIVYEIFPKGINTETVYDDKPYLIKAISIVDHWLSDEECIVVFAEENSELYEKRCTEFYTDIYNSGYDVYLYTASFYGRECILSFRDLEEYLYYAYFGIDAQYFTIVIPELKIVLKGGFDYTIYTIYTPESNMDALEKIVKKSGLFFVS